MSRHDYPRRQRLWIAVRLPGLPFYALGLNAQGLNRAEVNGQNENSQPANLALAIAEKQRIICSNTQAKKEGVVYGMDTTTAQLMSGCDIRPRNRELEEKTLAALAADLYRFTPYIETYTCEQPHQGGLLLEVSTCLTLFGGLKTLTTMIAQHLQQQGYYGKFGLAHSAKGAWLLSFIHHPIEGDEDKTVFIERLKALPIQLLYDHPKVVEALEKTGFTTLADITRQIDAQTISSLKKRFGAAFASAICDIFAIEQNFQQNSLFDKPLNVYQPVEFFSDRIQFEYPICQTDLLHHPIEVMLQKLSDFNRKRQWECQQIAWRFCDIHGNHLDLTVTCDNPQTHWQLFYDLTRIQVENCQLTFEVDTLELVCKNATPIQNRGQLLAFDDSRNKSTGSNSFAITAAKLKARLGDAAIFKLSYRDSFLPEVSNQLIPLNETCNQELPEPQQHVLRPPWLYPSPIALEERPNGLYYRGYLQLLIGPERIQGNWWDTLCARDYYVAQRHDNVRLWIYLDLHTNNWFAQGVFR